MDNLDLSLRDRVIAETESRLRTACPQAVRIRVGVSNTQPLSDWINNGPIFGAGLKHPNNDVYIGEVYSDYLTEEGIIDTLVHKVISQLPKG